MVYRIWQESKLKWSPQRLDWMNIIMRLLPASKNIMLVIKLRSFQFEDNSTI